MVSRHIVISSNLRKMFSLNFQNARCDWRFLAA
jgi:hypothetical protein